METKDYTKKIDAVMDAQLRATASDVYEMAKHKQVTYVQGDHKSDLF